MFRAAIQSGIGGIRHLAFPVGLLGIGGALLPS